MAAGIRRMGDSVTIMKESEYTGVVTHDVAVFYGLEGNLPRIFLDYRAQTGRAVFVDLGYFGRREGGRWSGYHKVAVNARHPTAYFRTPAHNFSRIARFDINGQDLRANGYHILLAGMGDKGAQADGYEPEEWERAAIALLRKHTNRPIHYRPKPSWKKARPIEGTVLSHRDRPIEEELRNCWAVVTHHSNVAVDAIVAGVPVFCWAGVGTEFASRKLADIERPAWPDIDRQQWLADIAFTQWSIQEMREGHPWNFLRSEGLV